MSTNTEHDIISASINSANMYAGSVQEPSNNVQKNSHLNTGAAGGSSFAGTSGKNNLSPKMIRPQNKVILGDSSDNVSILTDGMLN